MAKIVRTGSVRSAALKSTLAVAPFSAAFAVDLAAPLSSQAETFPTSFPLLCGQLPQWVGGRRSASPWLFGLWCLSFLCRSSDETPAGSASSVLVLPRLKIVCTETVAGLPLALGVGDGSPFCGVTGPVEGAAAALLAAVCGSFPASGGLRSTEGLRIP